MKLELVSCTNYVGTFFGLKDLSPEELMIAIARVSSDKEPEKRGKNINGLLSHCYKNNHWSVFDIVDVTFYVQTSIPRRVKKNNITFTAAIDANPANKLK